MLHLAGVTRTWLLLLALSSSNLKPKSVHSDLMFVHDCWFVSCNITTVRLLHSLLNDDGVEMSRPCFYCLAAFQLRSSMQLQIAGPVCIRNWFVLVTKSPWLFSGPCRPTAQVPAVNALRLTTKLFAFIIR